LTVELTRWALSDEELEVPPLAPGVAVEILSPDDRRIDIDDKINTYLRAGPSLVIVVDPLATARLEEGTAIEHAALPLRRPLAAHRARRAALVSVNWWVR
jgi:hypothetical protein